MCNEKINGYYLHEFYTTKFDIYSENTHKTSWQHKEEANLNSTNKNVGKISLRYVEVTF